MSEPSFQQMVDDLEGVAAGLCICDLMRRGRCNTCKAAGALNDAGDILRSTWREVVGQATPPGSPQG